jgi:hypothetical protein
MEQLQTDAGTQCRMSVDSLLRDISQLVATSSSEAGMISFVSLASIASGGEVDRGPLR